MPRSDTPLTSNNAAPTRDRLVTAMLNALRRTGFHGVGLSELLAQAGAPKGVMYHHFPGGKSELAIAAIDLFVHQISDGLQKLLHRHADPADALQAWMVSAQKVLSASGYQQGCPLASIASESTPEDIAIRQALATGFARVRQQLALALENAGVAPARSANLAALMVSAYEGALIQARVAGRVDPMQHTTEALVDLVRQSLSPQP